MNQTRYIAGAMSGTSADGIDVAIVRVEGEGPHMVPSLLLHHHRPYPPRTREQVFAIRARGSMSLRELADLAHDISLVYAAAVNEALLAVKLDAGDLACVAAHGQTLFHDPPLTLQWLDPALLAAEVGCAVVSDFRRADCAAGGQGAPLVPFADYILFRHETRGRVLLNIGGIANITYLAPGGALGDLIAFDTGPGNCISDDLVRRFMPDGGGFDANGAGAARGKALQFIVDQMLAQPYFHARPPKSTDGPAMIEMFQDCFETDPATFEVEDLLATACRITADSIVQSILRFLPDQPDELVVSGGGMKNKGIMDRLSADLPELKILSTNDLGIRGEAKEAMAFALLGAATLDGQPSNVPSVTGARRAVVLGTITPQP